MVLSAPRTAGHRKNDEEMPRILICLAALFCLVALIGCSDDEHITIPPLPSPETLTVSFQDGVSPNASYGGTQDAILENGPANEFRNGNFGTMPFDTIGSVRLGAALYERRLIIKMDLSLITDCSRVLTASLSMRIAPPAPDAVPFEAHRVDLLSWQKWVEGDGGVFRGVSWTTLDGAVPWANEGGDYEVAAFDQETASGDSTVTFALPPTLVRNWIKQPATNHGVIVKGTEPSSGLSVIVFMRECSRAAWRPRIDVTYIKGG
jgi:hypothetical protein